ncbi:MAG TPA: MFS transporter [Candidatus Acidoferrum sp.]|nr:MFS transporter [Candidatus Acidoferrum sp.]
MDTSRPKPASGNLRSPNESAAADPGPAIAVSARSGYFRWAICALLLFGTTKNYMDRQVLGVLKTTLQHDFGWNEIDYGNLVSAFQIAYAFGMVLAGRLIDRLGTRLGYALAMIFWSLASMGTALANSLSSFALSRYALGFGESAIFPASIKAVAEWFPKKERALATGIFNAGTSIGAIITPLVVPGIVAHWGWRGAFVGIGALGFVWLAFWLLIYRNPGDHSRVSSAELEYIRSDPPEPAGKIRWASLITLRQTWAFLAGKFLTDPVWWFYLFWVPGFLQSKHGLDLSGVRFPIVAIYLISDVGSVAGGWISSSLIRRGSTVNAARKTAMLLCAIGVVPVIFAYRVESTWSAVLLIGLAAACHQGFSANLYTLTSDMFPVRAVGSVVGIGGMAGAMAGSFSAAVVGHVLQWTGSYMVPFVMAGCAYLLAIAAIHVLAPRLEPARLGTDAQ